MWKKTHAVSIREDRLCLVLLVGLALVLLPMLVLAKYDIPSVDDYTNAVRTVHAWRQTHELSAVIRAGLAETAANYRSWQGTFSALFLFALQPAVFGEQWYFLTAWIMLVSLLGGTFYLSYVALHHLLGAARHQAVIVGAVLGAAFTQLLPSAVEGFYWWTGAVFYTFFFGLALFLYGELALAVFEPHGPVRAGRRAVRLLSLCVLSVVIGGGNYPMALLTAIFYVAALVVVFRKKRGRELVLPCVLFFAAFAVSMLAPGNGQRQGGYDQPSAVWAIKQSLSYAWQYAGQWLSALLVCLLVFLVPIFWQLVKKQSWDFRYPQWFALGSFCLYAALLCPIFYATHNPPPGRYADVAYYGYVIVLAADLFYFLGWLQRRLAVWGVKTPDVQEGRYPLPYLLVAAAAFALIFLIVRDSTYITSDRAIRDFHTGEAAAYYATAQQRLTMLNDETQKSVELPQFTVFPYNLYNNDVCEDPDDWRNTGIEAYYDKDAIVLAPEK